MHLLPLAMIEPPNWTTFGVGALLVSGLGFWAAKQFFAEHLASINKMALRLDSTERALHDKLIDQDRRLIRAEAADGEHQRAVERLEQQLQANTRITSEQNARIDGLTREVQQLTLQLVEWGARLDERIGKLPRRATDAPGT